MCVKEVRVQEFIAWDKLRGREGDFFHSLASLLRVCNGSRFVPACGFFFYFYFFSMEVSFKSLSSSVCYTAWSVGTKQVSSSRAVLFPSLPTLTKSHYREMLLSHSEPCRTR